MGVFDKLSFWKKKDDLGDLDKEFPKDLGGDFSANSAGFGDSWSNPTDSSSFGQSFGQEQPSFGGQQQSFGSQPSFSKQPPSSFGAQSGQFGQSPSLGQQPSFSSPGYSSTPAYAQQTIPHDADYINTKSLEVISSKIDALRATVESINARLANIERIAGQEEDNRRKRYY